MILLDTNVLSELMRPSPAARVVDWLDQQHARDIAVTAITVAEILHGIERLPDGKRKRRFATLAAGMFDEDFERRIFSFDADAAAIYASIVADAERNGCPVSMADAQIAAIAHQHEAMLATRNTGDFEPLGLALINPWDQT
ncbi:hypothetical protein C8D92_107195 [Tamilnaduibacter salinus]|uniref:Ribonuclease VapC n=1 Tax=Tamilnaduibacter salinus TaxID=1484056 RepID=A0A2U1CVE0_9GAMM|nr:type II toxin-antitoxin system VapC family toxin [Tamilnaduibacter salinus]PVY75472.1 hypothetical protein C8D92_107195 [Tamilnaduibacter salinus]